MTFKIAGCAGHGGNNSTPGKRTPDGEYEWNFNNEVILAFEEALKQYEDVEFLRTDDRTGKTDVPLKARTDKANDWGADIYISFHHNANTGKWGNWTGTETFTYLGSQPKSEKLAQCVHPRIVKVYGLKDRGMKKADFHIVRETHMPSILIEGGYMDSTIDIIKLRDHNILKAVGYAVAEGVVEYAGLKKKELVQNGWFKKNNKWFYFENNQPKNGWLKYKDKWYYIKNGEMSIGWVKDKGNWYFLDQSGIMMTGWIQDKNKHYYLSNDGSMVTGWMCIDKKWYFFNPSGDMASNVNVAVKSVTINADGSISKIN